MSWLPSGLENLAPETMYHVRVVASNVLGTVYGPDQTFTTQSQGGVFALPTDAYGKWSRRPTSTVRVSGAPAKTANADPGR